MQLNVVMLLEPDFVSMKLVVTLEPVISSAHLSAGFFRPSRLIEPCGTDGSMGPLKD